MLTEPEASRHTKSFPSAARARSSIPSGGDTDLPTFEPTAIQPKPSIVHRSTDCPSTTLQCSHTMRDLPTSVAILLDPVHEEENNKTEATHVHSLSAWDLPAPPGLPPPASPKRFKPPNNMHVLGFNPVIDELEKQLHYSYDADVPSKDAVLNLPPPPPRARFSPPRQVFSLMPAIELNSVVLDEGTPPSTKTIRDLEALCNWSVQEADREQQEFVRKTKAQKQIYETVFADLQNELAGLEVGNDIQESQLRLFEAEGADSDGEEEEGEVDDDDEGYEQDGGVDISDELEEVFPSSSSEASSGRYTPNHELDAEEYRVSFSELVDANTSEQEAGYDADTDFEHVAKWELLPGDDPFALEHPYLLPVQNHEGQRRIPKSPVCYSDPTFDVKNLLPEASELNDDKFEELCYPYTLQEIERQNEEISGQPVGDDKDREIEEEETENVLLYGVENKGNDQLGVGTDSDEEFDRQEAQIYRELERTRPLWSIYSKILPPPRDPPSWYPETLPTFGVTDPDVIPSLCFDRIETLAAGNGLSSVCVVRSMWPRRWNGVGLRKDSVWAMKLYPKEYENGESKRRGETLLHTEVDAYMRIAESPKEEKIGFAFLTNLEMTMTFRGNIALLMELMRTDLRTYMDDCRLEQRSIPRLMAQVAMGIATLHSIGIIHRDLKPENIFLDYRGNVKIGDFGTSFVTRSFMALQNDVDYDDAAAGTTEYMSPEMQSKNGTHGIEVDYWALGCVFFEMMADDHIPLFPRSRPREIEDWIVEYSKTPAGRHAFFEHEGFTETETDLLCGLLRPNPRRRFGIDEILEHRYFFLRFDGSSEFHHIDEALGRVRREPVFGPNEGPQTRLTPLPVDDTAFNWVNPYGAFFADQRTPTRVPGSQWP